MYVRTWLVHSLPRFTSWLGISLVHPESRLCAWVVLLWSFIIFLYRWLIYILYVRYIMLRFSSAVQNWVHISWWLPLLLQPDCTCIDPIIPPKTFWSGIISPCTNNHCRTGYWYHLRIVISHGLLQHLLHVTYRPWRTQVSSRGATRWHDEKINISDRGSSNACAGKEWFPPHVSTNPALNKLAIPVHAHSPHRWPVGQDEQPG